MREPSDEHLRLLIVVVVYRVADLTIECLRSLMPEVRSLAGVKVAVCENGSGGDVADRLQTAIREHGWEDAVWFLPIHPNRGFTGGNNAILDRALRWTTPPEFFLLLNTDTIVEPGAIAELLASIESDPGVGALGPSLIAPDESLQTSCFRDPTPWSEFLRAACTGPLDRLFNRRLVSIKPPHDTGPHEWTSFAAAMIRSSAIAETGTFDEGYYLYFDDPDLCWRLRCAGWRIAHCPSATIVHLEGAANDVPASRRERRRPPRYLYQSRARYFAKRHGIAGLWLANLCWHAGRCISLFRELLGRKPTGAAPCEWRDIWTNALRPWHAPHLPYPEGPAETAAAGIERGVAANAAAR
jgi:GT2 family glycosyltransferase